MPGITARRVVLRSGIALRVLESGPANGSPVLLLHGWGVSAYLWRHNILPLAAAGYRVVAADLPGHGLSDAPADGGRYDLAFFTARTFELLDALGIGRAAIVAQSMGGKVALQCALDAPSRVSQLQLYGPVGFGVIPPWQALAPMVPHLPGELPAMMVPRRVIAFVQYRVYGKLGWFSERDVDEYWAPTQFPAVVRAQLRMLKEFPWAPWEPAQLHALQVPTLVVFGTRDRTVRPVHAARLAAELPDGRLEWIVDGGHVVMEEVPGRINAMLLERLRG